MKMKQTECSETSAYKIQTLGNYPEENIRHRIRCLTTENDTTTNKPVLVTTKYTLNTQKNNDEPD
jgi:hypothetical protein